MAQPGAAPKAAAVPIISTWSQKDGWTIAPPSTDIPLQGDAKFEAGNKNCTFCFSPNNTLFGASRNVNVGTPLVLPVGSNNFSVQVCATDQGSTCTPGAGPKDVIYRIKVGSGGVGGR